jgi:hypothetical protein
MTFRFSSPGLESSKVSLWAYSAVWALWRAGSVISRLFPVSQRERQLADSLRADFRAIPEARTGSGSEARDEWATNQARLRSLVLSGDPRVFLTWDVIKKTMFVPFARYTPVELAFLEQRPDWNRWYSAIRERRQGLPFPYPLSSQTSANAIHHAYHLSRLEEHIGTPVKAFQTIVEFGGGYGSMCRIARALGFAGKYLIFDLPEFSALQRFYLGSVCADVVTVSDIERLRSAIRECEGPSLFIATWSLSEAPATLRRQILPLVSHFDAFLIAYQDRFGEEDNKAFFESFSSIPGTVRFDTSPIAHLPGNSYVFGLSDRTTQLSRKSAG